MVLVPRDTSASNLSARSPVARTPYPRPVQPQTPDTMTPRLLIPLAALFFEPLASAALVTDIDLTNATINGTSWALTDSGVTYNEKNLERNSVRRPWITPDGTLKFEHLAWNYSGGKQRTEYYAARNQPFRQTHYIGFRLRVLANPSDVDQWTVISQVQQHGHWVSPFLAVGLRREGEVLLLSFVARNQHAYNFEGRHGPSGESINLLRHPIARNTWYDVVIGFNPNPTGDGEVRIWINHVLARDWKGNFGFPAGCDNRPIVEQFQNSFGIYRASQNSNLVLYFDDYRLGDDPDQVMP